MLSFNLFSLAYKQFVVSNINTDVSGLTNSCQYWNYTKPSWNHLACLLSAWTLAYACLHSSSSMFHRSPRKPRPGWGCEGIMSKLLCLGGNWGEEYIWLCYWRPKMLWLLIMSQNLILYHYRSESLARDWQVLTSICTKLVFTWGWGEEVDTGRLTRTRRKARGRRAMRNRPTVILILVLSCRRPTHSLTDWRGQKTQSRLILVFSTTNALPTDTGAAV